MKIKALYSVLFFLFSISSTLMAWEPVKSKMITEWGEKVTPENVWQSYPRPQLKRERWKNLNGIWECEVTSKNVSENKNYSKEILVPFCYESSLSGIAKEFKPENKLWYKRTFTIDKTWKSNNILLHFGAVDYNCFIFVNGKKIGQHVGGNNAFYVDITDAVKIGSTNELIITVTDPTDTESCTRGKQSLNPRGIWYTPVSGIWKTVWIEPVPKTYIKSICPTSDIHSGRVDFEIDITNAKGNEIVSIQVFDNDSKVAEYNGNANDAHVVIPEPILWSPSTPKLYDLKVSLSKGSKEIDSVVSYCALREVTKIKDECGNSQLALNGETLFQYGPLDQGWWPDGLLTPPSEEAMLYDMIQIKKMGFNMIRKHIKVEPELYYYYADSLGIMIWQDMPSGFSASNAKQEHVAAASTKDWDAPTEHVNQWKYEYHEMIENLKFFPCITTWVVFNEGWGQFRTEEMTEYAYELDRSRIINAVTGWADRNVGDMYDIHNYPSTSMKLKHECNGRISALGEFGGLSYSVPNHVWDTNKSWGYRNMDANLELMNNYLRLVYDLEGLIAHGLNAAVYTQTSDVEIEVNGLMTYDRAITKLNPQILNILHSRLYSQKPLNWRPLVERKSEGRLKLAGGETGEWTESFTFDGREQKFSLWISGNVKAQVLLNGKLIFDGPVRQTRNYNHFNISDYNHCFQQGENKIEFILKSTTPKRETIFDYSITTY